MLIRYKTCLNKITKEEFANETSELFIYPSGRSVYKRSGCASYFETWQDAKDSLIQKASKLVILRKRFLYEYDCDLRRQWLKNAEEELIEIKALIEK